MGVSCKDPPESGANCISLINQFRVTPSPDGEDQPSDHRSQLLMLAEREVIHLHPELSQTELKVRWGADGASAAQQRAN